MYKALIVDDHPFIRSSVKMLLQHEQFEVVAEADNGADAVQLAREHLPDLIILDIAIPRLDGLEVLSRIAALRLPSKILVLTSQSALFYSMRCMKAGAAGFISKTNELDELVKAIKTVMDGYTFFPNLANSSVRRSDVEATDLELIQSLSDRELVILQQLSMGLTNKEIGDAMLISNKTVSTYKTRLIEKLNVKSVVYLADFAKRNNLI
ncbi:MULTISPECIES: response regulator transcription factor [Pseudomonas]|jgi:two-component system response regulator EvgA|uniref:response regulator transcription factor n=1 Tax=Pseudomonas TaxID=286 RepID=UPI000CD5031E|nr:MULTISPECIES: response regulator transcription factor [unclassified Pseudomonas]MBK5344069.1 response regulator transcription factor [Pseudomonas sp. TH49]MCU1771435.1 response regulator transcription factor [Pseudomonas sp. 13B_3.2_Bac1]RBC00940.1 DNA-binding response regulator [Pseudomonas sp. MWU12-2115]RBL68681.1 DNA-binding response regulator [Pseudomonas sp. MWU13-2625]